MGFSTPLRRLPLSVLLAATACGPTGPRVSVLPPGSMLPTDSECVARVVRSSSEPRPDNATYNQTTPTQAELQTFTSDTFGGVDARANTGLRARVTGAFTGTTDEIIQWASCKWGFDADAIRAQAVTESYWHENAAGDATTDSTLWPPGATCESGASPQTCYQSYGLLQIKWVYWKSAWPSSRDSTAFNVDAALAWRRVCYEGYIQWLGAAGTSGYPSYGPGDFWGCIGQWLSGGWYDSGAIRYIQTVQQNLTSKAWAQPGF